VKCGGTISQKSCALQWEIHREPGCRGAVLGRAVNGREDVHKKSTGGVNRSEERKKARRYVKGRKPLKGTSLGRPKRFIFLSFSFTCVPKEGGPRNVGRRGGKKKAVEKKKTPQIDLLWGGSPKIGRRDRGKSAQNSTGVVSAEGRRPFRIVLPGI